MIDKFDDYSLSMKEVHHVHKKDAPSGTGKKMKEIIESEVGRFNDIPIESIREGEVPGTHIVNFDSPVDTIKLEHEAKSREGFALGSVMAADWVKGKKGFFTIEDMMDEIIK
jgi:4-hydroxy-tetrahydrodipicolinate reductase